MLKKSSLLLLFVLLALSCKHSPPIDKLAKEIELAYPQIISHVVDLKSSEINFYLKDETGNNFKNFANLDSLLRQQNKKLIFAMNGGMYNKDLSPQGLYIEEGKRIADLDTIEKGFGNFYLQPNGVFSITKDQVARISETKSFKDDGSIKYATQSGPMLVIDDQIHPKFTEGSKNVHIRNGVGMLPDGRLLFAMSKETINFFDFASFFKENGCKNALYLDGFVSRTFLPSKNWIQKDGNFGVIIGQVE